MLMTGQDVCIGPERVAACMDHERAVSGHTRSRWMVLNEQLVD